MNRLLTVLVLPALFVSVFAFSPERAGFAPAGTLIPELCTPTARHFSNGDGSIRAVISVSPGSAGIDNLTTIGEPAYSGYVWQLYGVSYGRPISGMLSGKESAERLERAFAEWNINSIPDGSTVNSVICSTYSKVYQSYPLPVRVPLRPMTLRPSTTPNNGTGNASLYADCGDGTPYASYESPNPSPARWLSVELGAQACADVESRLSADWFAVGYDHEGSGASWAIEFDNQASGYKPTLVVDYYPSGAPARPTPASPANGGTVTTYRPTLTVASMSGVDSFQFRLYEGSTELSNVKTTLRTWTVDFDLTHGATYQWDCRAHNPVGWGPYFTPRWSFLVQIPAPGAPTLVSPANNGYVQALRPTLTVSPVAGADRYWFRVFLPGGVVPVAEYSAGSSTSWTLPSDLVNGQKYEWTCAAHNVAGWGPFATRWTFTVLLPPATPVPSSPANGGYVPALRPTLAVGVVPGATSYEFRVYNQAGSTLIRSGTSSGASWTLDIDLANNTAYQWDCRAVNLGGPGGYFSPRWTFTVLLLPNTPVPTAPANGATVATLTPTLSVGAVPTATLYRFNVYRQSNGSLQRTADVAANSWTVNPALNDGWAYTWECAAYNASGWGSFFSPRWSFTATTTPPAPNPTAPANGGVVNALTPTLRVDAIMGCDLYEFRVYDAGGNLIRGPQQVASNSWTVGPALSDNASYSWDCRARTALNVWGACFSPRWAFTVILLPPAPTQVSPPNASIVTTLRPTLQVQGVTGATQYEFRVLQGATVVRTGLSASNAWTLDADLASNTTYNWDCRAKNGGGWGPRCAQWSFSVYLVPSAPVPTTPANGSTVATLQPQLRVNGITGCTQYHFRVYDAANNLVVEDASSPTSFWTVPVGALEYGKTYCWDCRAYNPAGWGPFFDPRWSFAVSSTPPAPVQISPPDGSIVSTLAPQLVVGRVIGGTAYRFRISEAGVVVRQSVEADSFWNVMPALEDGHDYRWDCQVSNGFWGPYSGEWGFSVSLLPAAPTPLSPANGSEVLSLRPELGVAALARATWYRFQLYDTGTDALVEEDSSATPTFEPATVLEMGKTYWWQCQAKNPAGWGPYFAPRWSFVVGRVWQYGWQEVARPMPAEPSMKNIKDGGWLAGFGRSIYAARGNKTGDFFRYDAIDSAWTMLESIPAGESGKRKLPGKGCAATSDGGRFIYMVKGNNTLGFWRYDTGGDSWTRLPSVPEGPDGKNVKGGTDLAYYERNDTGWVYLLKGYRTEFYRYNVVAAAWDTLENAPYGAGQAKYDKGSFLVGDGAGSLYAHQAKYNDGNCHYMFRFDAAAGRWSGTPLHGMPLSGLHGGALKSKKSKDGGAGAWQDGRLYALKGGGTQGFYRYFADGDTWQELDTIPVYGSSLKKKYVKGGGDLAFSSLGAFFALKGNNSRELWRYIPPARYAARSTPCARSGAMAEPSTVFDVRFSISPNPLAAGFATIRCTTLSAGPVAITVFDVAGRSVFLTRPLGHSLTGPLPLDLRGLANGVYLVRLDAGDFSASQKLVVQR